MQTFSILPGFPSLETPACAKGKVTESGGETSGEPGDTAGDRGVFCVLHSELLLCCQLLSTVAILAADSIFLQGEVDPDAVGLEAKVTI